MTDYIILRDLQASVRGTQPSTSEPFGWTARGAAVESPPEGLPNLESTSSDSTHATCKI